MDAEVSLESWCRAKGIDPEKILDNEWDMAVAELEDMISHWWDSEKDNLCSEIGCNWLDDASLKIDS